MKDIESDKQYVGNGISPEQFISEHTFSFVAKGILNVYDGTEYHSLKEGECFLARKNRFARYDKLKINNELEKYFVFFDEPFLRKFQQKYMNKIASFKQTNTFIKVKPNELIPSFIQSLIPYYKHGVIKELFADVKREELLLILLQKQPELTGVFFDYGVPQKINLEEFMHKNYKFNVSIERLAFMTGRSMSAFKRDFKATFNESPNKWLVKKRLEQAYFLIKKEKQKPSNIYIDLGFENLSHFSRVFKQHFGINASRL